MEWQDQGFVLAVRRHGESAIVLSALTRSRGRHAGLVKGGASRRARALYQPGNALDLTWRGRLAEHLGAFTGELVEPFAIRLLDDPFRLAGLVSLCALLETTLPERDPHPALYDVVAGLLPILVDDEGWLEAYVRFELALLTDLGFGLDLSACAVTGTTSGLVYVSPSSGRAVSAGGAGDYAPRLLPLPGFLIGAATADLEAVRDGLRLTGHFLRRHLFDATDRPLPPARERLLLRLSSELQPGP